jgi:outer membrane protein TolC
MSTDNTTNPGQNSPDMDPYAPPAGPERLRAAKAERNRAAARLRNLKLFAEHEVDVAYDKAVVTKADLEAAGAALTANADTKVLKKLRDAEARHNAACQRLFRAVHTFRQVPSWK